MNPFDEPQIKTLAALEFQMFGEASYVATSQLLDILKQRATLSLRAAATPGIDTRTADFERGRFAEMKALYEAINELTPTL